MRTINIDAGIESKAQFHQNVTVESAEEAVDWLIKHNGEAPETAQALLIAFKTAIICAKQ